VASDLVFGSESSLLCFYSADTVHGPGGTAELPSALPMFAAFGECLAARLVRRGIASLARLHGQTCWQSLSSGAARSFARSLWLSAVSMCHRGMRG
jgi:hypothetical protein